MKTGHKIALAILALWLGWEAWKLIQAGESLVTAPFKALSGIVTGIWKSITGIFSGSGRKDTAAPVDLFPNYRPSIEDEATPGPGGVTAPTAWGSVPAVTPPAIPS